MALRGIIFDMDGVLCDSEPFICEAACRMFAERHGVRVRPEDFIPFVGAGEDRYLGGVAQKHGARLDLASDKARTYEIYLQIIQGRLGPLPGVREFIAECRRRGLKLAVATSADRVKMEGNLREIGLPADTFDVTVNGLEIERKKPHPDIFLLAAKRLGLRAPDCLVVEDAPNGIQAAKSAGCRCLGLTTSFDETTLKSAGADLVAPDLAHAPTGLFRTARRLDLSDYIFWFSVVCLLNAVALCIKALVQGQPLSFHDKPPILDIVLTELGVYASLAGIVLSIVDRLFGGRRGKTLRLAGAFFLNVAAILIIALFDRVHPWLLTILGGR